MNSSGEVTLFDWVEWLRNQECLYLEQDEPHMLGAESSNYVEEVGIQSELSLVLAIGNVSVLLDIQNSGLAMSNREGTPHNQCDSGHVTQPREQL